MTIKEAIKERHSVRRYLDRPISGNVLKELESYIDAVRDESGLTMDLVLSDGRAFDTALAHYGHFSGVQNYIAISAPKGSDEDIGYFGEKIVLFAQTLGLNTCWVALTYSKAKVRTAKRKGVSVRIVIAVGYGAEDGKPHKSKDFSAVAKADGVMPAWFVDGVEAALLAPTAMNQQKFQFILVGNNSVKAVSKLGFWSKVDLGIVKQHFEIGAGNENFTWA